MIAAARAGAYAWARCGYELARGPAALRAFVESARDALDQAVRDGHAEATQAAALLAGVRDGTLASARQVSEFGRDSAWIGDRGRTMWLGRLPFDGYKWNGIKYLGGSDSARG
jgi:hypothetical protein